MPVRGRPTGLLAFMPICMGMERGTAASGSPVLCVRRAWWAPVIGTVARQQPGGTRMTGPRPTWSTATSTAAGPNQLWVADITYVPTMAGFLYLAVVLDAWSRKIVGWAMANHLRAELVLDAMEMAVGQRRPKDVIHHSDQGSQYTSVAFGKRCGEAGVRPSMGSVGDAYDNAMAESFFSTLEAELLSRRRFRPRRALLHLSYSSAPFYADGAFVTHAE